MPEWLIQYVPEWKDAFYFIFAGAMLTALWRAFCFPKKIPRRWAAFASTVITFLLAWFVLWSRSREPIKAAADALLIGAMSPGVWVVIIAAAQRWAPWIAAALGEDRRSQPRIETWTHEQRKRELFEDTGQRQLSDLTKWRKEHGDG